VLNNTEEKRTSVVEDHKQAGTSSENFRAWTFEAFH